MATYGWNPKTGEQELFATDEARVTAGFIDHHPSDEAKGGVGEVGQADRDPPLGRDEVIVALTEGGVNFNPNATDHQLDNALKGALRKALGTAGIEFAKTDSTRRLLEIVRTPPAA